MKFNSIKFEISFLYTLILGVILVIFSGFFYFILVFNIHQELDFDLQLKAEEIGNSIRAYVDIHQGNAHEVLPAAQAIIEEEHRHLKWWWVLGSGRRWMQQVKKIDVNEGYINFVNAKGQSLANSKNMDDELMAIFLKDRRNSKGNQPSYRNIVYRQQRIRVINFPFSYKKSQRYIIQVGISPQPVTQLLQGWVYSIGLSIPVILLLTSSVGWLLVTRSLSPVQKIIDTAQKISSEDLNARVQEEQYAVEMQSLVEAFNEMITRLGKSFKHIEEFSSHVAHELKTPLTIIRGETELALQTDCQPQEYRRTLNVIAVELNKMLKTIDDLLFLAKVDYQPKAFKFEEFNFIEFFREITEQSRILAASKKIKIRAELPNATVMIKGDKLHLRRLFFNLIDNALKFTPASGRIDLLVKVRENELLVAVADTGKGIDPKNLEKIFDKFFSEDKTAYGHGLGLSIARAIVKVHQGRIDVQSQLNEGTTFTVILPVV